MTVDWKELMLSCCERKITLDWRYIYPAKQAVKALEQPLHPFIIEAPVSSIELKHLLVCISSELQRRVTTCIMNGRDPSVFDVDIPYICRIHPYCAPLKSTAQSRQIKLPPYIPKHFLEHPGRSCMKETTWAR